MYECIKCQYPLSRGEECPFCGVTIAPEMNKIIDETAAEISKIFRDTLNKKIYRAKATCSTSQ
jgi:hypothetical protein